MLKRVIGIWFLLMIPYLSAMGKEVIDMAGRKVVIPDKITRVIPFDNKTNMLLYPIAGDKMIAKAWAGENASMKYISDEYLAMKEVDLKNAEEVLKVNPDVIIVGTFVNKNTSNEVNRYTKFAQKINKPLIIVDLEIMNLDKTYDFLGNLLGLEKESGECSEFIRTVYSEVAGMKKPAGEYSVYIANAESGLRTAPQGSLHAQLFDILGLKNAVVAPMDAKGFSVITIEQLMAVNPDYIFCMGKGNSNPYKSVKDKKVWSNLQAVKSGQIYKVPSDPFVWFDMPPSINRLCGLIWFCGIFNMHESGNTQRMITDFYRIFYKYNLTEKEYGELISR